MKVFRNVSKLKQYLGCNGSAFQVAPKCVKTKQSLGFNGSSFKWLKD